MVALLVSKFFEGRRDARQGLRMDKERKELLVKRETTGRCGWEAKP
jgi:hypothetical protein